MVFQGPSLRTSKGRSLLGRSLNKMSIFDFIENLQKKPVALRKRILALTLVVIMGIIVIIWATTFNLKLNSEPLKKASAPFDFIKQGISDIYGYFKNFKPNQ